MRYSSVWHWHPLGIFFSISLISSGSKICNLILQLIAHLPSSSSKQIVFWQVCPAELQQTQPRTPKTSNLITTWQTNCSFYNTFRGQLVLLTNTSCWKVKVQLQIIVSASVWRIDGCMAAVIQLVKLFIKKWSTIIINISTAALVQHWHILFSFIVFLKRMSLKWLLPSFKNIYIWI